MKYEMIFGDENLFDGAGEFTGIDIVTRNVDDGLYRTSRLSDSTPPTLRNNPVVAMRRIIKEPNRWTWEDKRTGVLPEVGSIFTYRGETLTCHFIDGDGEVWAHDIDNKIVTPSLRDCQPIETPAEKAQREEDEFVNELMKDKDVYYTSSEQMVMCRKTARAAYRKLKGGE